ncbi:MAG: ribonuclease H-like domain-containing protein [Proteobacteria bacterium]|nr:ribonuclease H-like domain-containing protein [Pseudomonadota bacterium]
MDLRQKLRRLKTASEQEREQSSGKTRTPSSPSEPERLVPRPSNDSSQERGEQIDKLRAMIGQVVERDNKRRAGSRTKSEGPDWSELPGEDLTTEHGVVRLVTQWLEPDHAHGKVPVKSALEVDTEALAYLALDPALTDVKLEKMLILDTETTGLAGGTGTVPFMVGLAWFEDGALVVEQLLLKGLGQEVPLLKRLAERLLWADFLVTYNGKSFDWPLLRTRFIMNRVPAPPVSAHLDLLHCCRRVLKQRMDSVRLVDMETEVLGFYREGDVDGSEIPGIYFDFLRGGPPTRLLPVLEHNANDVIALAAIMGRIVRHFESVIGADDPMDHLGYAKVAAKAKDLERAFAFARAAASGAGSFDVSVEAHMLTADLARKNGDFEASAAELDQALSMAGDSDIASRIHLTMAKLYEHRIKDLTRAMGHAEHTLIAEGDETHEKRIARLKRKIEKQAKKK